MFDDGMGRFYDFDVDVYVFDGYGGKNVVRVVEGCEVFYVEFDLRDLVYFSIVDKRIVVRFEVKRDIVEFVVFVMDYGNYMMKF